MQKNRYLTATAGSGKTTYLINEALSSNGNVLITTYTTKNRDEIIKKIIERKKSLPSNITVQTWVSFLLQHGVKPYQGSLMEKKITGYMLVNSQSALKTTWNNKPIYYKEEDIEKHYFTSNFKIYSDKLSKFVVKCNSQTNGEVINRISRIYSHIFIDEVQDLAGSDLDLLKLFFKSSSTILLVGDNRQVTYLTHIERLNSAYNSGQLEKFIIDKKLDCLVDKTTLLPSHRNNLKICNFSSKLYPKEPISYPCECVKCRNLNIEHEGVFIIKNKDLSTYISRFNPTILRYKESGENELNFGESKGLTFDRVLIYPTSTIKKYLTDGLLVKTIKKGNKIVTAEAFDIAKFYVAVTRARHSVAIVYDYSDEDSFIDDIEKYNFIQ